MSLHFAPLGRLFHVCPYYATAIAGTVVCGAGFAVSASPYGVAALGLCMTTVMWISAIYILRHADGIAERACAEPWATRPRAVSS